MHVIFVGTGIPLLLTSGDVCFGFQSQSGQPNSHLVEKYISQFQEHSEVSSHL